MKKLKVVLSCSFIMLLIYLIALCATELKKNNYVFINNGLKIKSNAIFFIESSGADSLNSRQACSAESAARANPHRQIHVILLKSHEIPDIMHVSFCKSNTLMCVLERNGVNFWVANLKKFARGTPFESDILDLVKQSLWPAYHTSDFMRFLTLYKFSGVYLDLDMVVTKSFDTLPRNWAVREDGTLVAAGAIAMSDDSIGREVANSSLFELRNTYNPRVWNNNGVGVITRVLQRRCSVALSSHMSAATCHGFEVIGPKYFYPIPLVKMKQFFSLGNILRYPYAYHLWNHASEKEVLGSGCLYEKLAKNFCPAVFSFLGRYFR